MSIKSLSTGLLALASLSVVTAHSRVTNFVIDGTNYDGFNTRITNNPKVLAAWGTSMKDDGWVGANAYSGPDIVCHANATNAMGHVPVAAGGKIDFQWAGWPESHHGPVLTYLAYCGSERGACESIDKSKLEFFTIDRLGLVDPNKNASQFATAWGVWASDLLIQNNASWVVEIPPRIAPGYYVLRHEIIALHFVRYPALGPQHYPQCINLQITGGGTERPSGVPGTKLYEPGDEGLTYDISQYPLPDYPIPGPTLISNAVPDVPQTKMIITRTASAIPGNPSMTATTRTNGRTATTTKTTFTTRVTGS